MIGKEGYLRGKARTREKTWQVSWNHGLEDAAVRDTFCEGHSRAGERIARWMLDLQFHRRKNQKQEWQACKGSSQVS
jgi:hypothetical protein